MKINKTTNFIQTLQFSPGEGHINPCRTVWSVLLLALCIKWWHKGRNENWLCGGVRETSSKKWRWVDSGSRTDACQTKIFIPGLSVESVLEKKCSFVLWWLSNLVKVLHHWMDFFEGDALSSWASIPGFSHTAWRLERGQGVFSLYCKIAYNSLLRKILTVSL